MVEISGQLVSGLLNSLELQPAESQVNCLQRHSQFLIRFLRQNKIHSCPQSQELVKKVVQRTIELISSRCDQPLCDEAIILANNVFGLDGHFLRKILETRSTLRNLRNYCMVFFKKYEDAQNRGIQATEISKLDFRLYSVLYLLAVFASHRTADDNERRAVAYFLSRSLLRKFLSLRVQRHIKPETYFLFSVVLVYASRPTQGTKYLSAAKHFMLRHLTIISSGDKTAFNYLHCLRILLSNGVLTHQDVIRNAVVEFIVANVEKHLNESHLVYALDSLRVLLIGQPACGRKCVSLGLLQLLLKEYPRQRLLIARLFDKLVSFLSNEDLLTLSRFILSRLRTEVHQPQTLKVLNGILNCSYQQTLLQLLTEGLLDDLDSLLNRFSTHPMLGLVMQALDLVATACRSKIPSLYPMVVSKIYSLKLIGSTTLVPQDMETLLERLEKTHPRT